MTTPIAGASQDRYACLLLLAACAPPDLDDLFTSVEARHNGESGEAQEVEAAFAEVVDGAERTLSVALPGLSDPLLTDAILAAWDREVDVQVAVDADRADEPGVVALQNAGVPLRLADDGVTFFEFETNGVVSWTSEQIQMSHAFAVADTSAWITATRAGDTVAGPVVWFAGRGEDIAEHILLEHVQIFGGTDATAANAFNAPSKSINDTRWLFATQSDELLRVHFGPQERLIKAITDSVYAARSSVRILTDDLSDRGLATALQLKAQDGFDVEVIVGPGFGDAYAPASEVLRQQTPDVVKLQTLTVVPVPTLVFIDFDQARDGRYHRPRVLTLTHPIYSAARYDQDTPITTDQYCDGTLVVLQGDGEPSAPLQDLASIYSAARAVTTEL